ncbi:ROK family glucokinase [Domibacillus sp. A3M-37]|uniref:ROK family glucokinase n=1 Tax=Domibacillus sp. A3M-37 TaxID=2962037 RepID=UPI0020B6BA98|nr:ROK family glucokinase [Domibacillus sp. A3M-37]MCP3764229.1 ROK family glucokinase [Domibacillus sp. A3M-37]
MAEKRLAAFDIGGTSIKMAFLTTEGDIIRKWSIPTDRSDSGARIVGDIARSFYAELAADGLTTVDVLAAGVGAPGPADPVEGTISGAVNIGWPNGYPLKNLLEEAIELPVFIENDANCAALGEMWRGAGSGTGDVVCVTLGTGVGGGVVSKGMIITGVNGAAGEIGHITVEPENGFLCNCGKHGCLETVASATGIVNLYKQEGKEAPDARTVFEQAAAGDEAAKRVIDRCAFYLGLAIGNIANIVNPAKIVLGGGVSEAGAALLTPLEGYVRQYTFPRAMDVLSIEKAQLGNDAGVIGAAYLAKVMTV